MPSLQELLAQADWVQGLAAAMASDEATRSDLVQETWVVALGHEQPVREPRAWLRSVMQNLVRQRGRAARRRAAREERAARPESVEGPDTVVERAELHRRLVDCVMALPEPGRTLVLERYFEGLAPRALARRHGVPLETVRTRLKRALVQLREAMARNEGSGRGDWRALAVPWAGSRPGTWGAAAGVLIMTTTKCLAAGAALLLLGLGTWMLGRGPAAAPSVSHDLPMPDVPAASVATEALPERAAVASLEMGTSAEPPTAITGSLTVRAEYDDGAVAADVVVSVRRRDGEPRVGVRRGRTDAAGRVRFEGVPPERVRVGTDRSYKSEEVEVRAGEDTEVTLVLAVCLEVTGIVVDPSGGPVAGADVSLAPVAMSDHDAQVVATSGADGRFRLRSGFDVAFVGARARGYAPSRFAFVGGLKGAALDVRLELPGAGGAVEGTVVDARGRGVGDAIVRVGAGRLDTVRGGPDGAEPTPVQVWTDAAGAFVAEGVPPGEQEIAVRAAGLAPWQGTCVVVAAASARVAVTIVEGATVCGTVCDEKGVPIVDAVIRSGERGALTARCVVTGADGSFVLTGLAPGEVSLHARHALLGEAKHALVVGAGATARWDVRFERGVVLTGRLVRDDGRPVSGGRIAVRASRGDGERAWSGSATSGRDGRFELANWPGGLVDVEVYGHGIERLMEHGLDPAAGELLLQTRAVGVPNARIVGRVCAPDGTPVPNATVSAHVPDGRQSAGLTFTAPVTGQFELTRLQPETWRVTIEAEGYAPWRSEPITVADGGEADVGAVHLQVGGIVQVQLEGERPAKLSLLVYDGDGKPLISIPTLPAPLRSRAVAPGSYQLRVRCEGLAEQSLPVVVRAGETTMITVDVGRGR